MLVLTDLFVVISYVSQCVTILLQQLGSLQEFVHHNELVADISPSRLSVQQVTRHTHTITSTVCANISLSLAQYALSN
jgi:hypothetical protein